MMQFSDQVRLALGDAACSKLVEMHQVADIIFSQMRELHQIRLEFSGEAIYRHALNVDVDTRAEMIEADKEHSESMKMLAMRMSKVGSLLQDQSRELLARLDETARKIGALENDLRRAQARVKEHPCNDPNVRQQVFNMTDGRCFYCDTELSIDGLTPGAEFNVDHIMPRSSGGPDHLMNYVPACGPCNVSKNAAHLVDFFKRRKHPRLKVVGGQE